MAYYRKDRHGKYHDSKGRYSSASIAFNTERLLDIETGVLADEMLSLVEDVHQRAVAKALNIMQHFPGQLDLSQDIQMLLIPETNQYIIGIQDMGPISRYLADKEEFEGSWLEDALEEVFGG